MIQTFLTIPHFGEDTGHTLMMVIKFKKYLSANKKNSKSKATRTSKDLLWKHLLPSNVKDDNNNNASRHQHDDQPPAKCMKTIPEQCPAAPDSDIEELPAPHQSTTYQTPSPPPHDTHWHADSVRRPHYLSPIPQVGPTAMMQKMFKQQQQQMQ
ncbi:hypothetical protein DXG01_006250 [Tephrocybe rancida]|nr:hypothetical protein DXG01_006250 [Tephrocybe rancida]